MHGQITESKILEVLNNLLTYEEIYACMLVRKNLEGIIPPIEKFKKEIEEIWEILHEVMEEVFIIIEKYSKYGYELGEIYFRVLDYEVMFYILPDSDTALVAIVPSLANRGLIEIIMEKGRRRIMEILGVEYG